MSFRRSDMDSALEANRIKKVSGMEKEVPGSAVLVFATIPELWMFSLFSPDKRVLIQMLLHIKEVLQLSHEV
eukprot:CAMPEP_0178963566 /NCGR_PEP_ID=MMETSP0789-20121207/15110_1 /TAXON_ID=3005 /ORGANISM="Rhizosolenia setigera, Strain CCMP 1694" /LENGTH=71 /DNA_ID=CAMNT_0020648079 /DNA_START=648 /DNA_END=863 /DNA_ORIENTATION=-